MWWFGGNQPINGPDSAIFMLNFGPFWSVGIMTFEPSFFNYFLSFFLFHVMILMKKKEHYVVVWGKLVHKQPRFGHFHAKFRPFWSVGIMTKKFLRLSFFIFFVSISHNDSYEQKRTFCGGLEEIYP